MHKRSAFWLSDETVLGDNTTLKASLHPNAPCDGRECVHSKANGPGRKPLFPNLSGTLEPIHEHILCDTDACSHNAGGKLAMGYSWNRCITRPPGPSASPSSREGGFMRMVEDCCTVNASTHRAQIRRIAGDTMGQLHDLVCPMRHNRAKVCSDLLTAPAVTLPDGPSVTWTASLTWRQARLLASSIHGLIQHRNRI